MKRFALLITLTLMGCGLSTGGFYKPEGPHPRINVAAEGRIGPVSILHTPVSNADPVTDLTVISVSKGIQFGNISPYLGAGWQISRLWGTCDVDGMNCVKTYSDGYAISGGVTYMSAPLRIDLRALAFDNSPVGARSSFPLGIEALVFLIGFDL